MGILGSTARGAGEKDAGAKALRAAEVAGTGKWRVAVVPQRGQRDAPEILRNSKTTTV